MHLKKNSLGADSLYQIVNKIKQQKVENPTMNITTLMKHIQTLTRLTKGLRDHHCLPLQSLSLLTGLLVPLVSSFFPLSSRCTCSLHLRTRSPYALLLSLHTLFFQSTKFIYLCDHLIHFCLVTLDAMTNRTLSVLPTATLLAIKHSAR